MTDMVSVLVDTNVILDIFQDDPHWASWSEAQLSGLVGRMIVNPMIYAELGYVAGSTDAIDKMLYTLGLEYREVPRPALFLAAQAYKTYRQRGGNRTAPLADFFIGAHAAVLDIPILTRDTARYRSYFPEVHLIAPDGER